MQLLSVAVAKSVWLFDPNDLNPTGKNIFPDALMWIGEKYLFQTYPKSIVDIDQESKGLLFKTGVFHTEQGGVAVNFSFFNDGIVTDSWASTEVSDKFADDVLLSVSQQFGLAYSPSMIRNRRYVSEVIVSLNCDLSSFNPKLNNFYETLNDVFSSHSLPPFQLTGAIFAPDSSASSYKPPGFMIERKANVPFKENRYWSKSPFQTKDHLHVIEKFEELVGNP